MKPLWCPRCHKKLIPPEFISNANIQGKIKIKCSDEKCTGSITIKPKKNEQIENNNTKE